MKLDLRTNDFIVLFNTLWYRDFPMTGTMLHINSRALWTTHNANTVKRCADLLGLFTRYETGSRTDAVITDAADTEWARIEWEWAQAWLETVNELDKLASTKNLAPVSIFINYSRTDEATHREKNLDRIRSVWKDLDRPLLAFLITFTRPDSKRKGMKSSKRTFQELETHIVVRGESTLLRSQPALPWEVPDTRWSARVQANHG